MKSLHDFARNSDGKSYDGRKVAQWLFEAMIGKPMSDEEAQQVVSDAQRKANALKNNIPSRKR